MAPSQSARYRSHSEVPVPSVSRPRSTSAAVALLVAAAVAVLPSGVALARPVAGLDAGTAASSATAAPAAAAAAAAAARPAAVTQLRRAVAGSVVCDLVRGLRVCSHGDDAQLQGGTTAAGEGDSAASTASTRIGCYTRGPRVQTVYARPATEPDRYAATLRSFQGWAGAVEKAVDDSARKTRGARHVRFASVPDGESCSLSVLRVTLPGKAFGSFSATISALQDLGLDEPDVKYLVWTDAKGYCGVASAYQDDVAGQDNLNNGRYPSYARIDRSCWGRAETHELMHMLGAVQQGAPHATRGMHCRDGSDVMCYADGTAGSTQTAVCPTTQSRLLDCRGDDYFSTAPASGSWLATHWNTASSAFLARGWTDPAPSQPAPATAPAPSAAPAAQPSPTASASPSPSPTSGPRGGSLLPLPLPTLLVQP